MTQTCRIINPPRELHKMGTWREHAGPFEHLLAAELYLEAEREKIQGTVAIEHRFGGWYVIALNEG
jgi:hypothetical protein